MTVAQYFGTFEAVPSHSTIGFGVKHMIAAVFRTSFEDVEATVVGSPTGFAVSGRVRADSIAIKAPAEFREHVVYGDGFLDAKRHEYIEFRSFEVLLKDDGHVTLRGHLTLRGVTKEFSGTGTVQPVVEDPFGGLRTGVEFATTVDRREWGITWQKPMPNGGGLLGHDIDIRVSLELVKKADSAHLQPRGDTAR